MAAPSLPKTTRTTTRAPALTNAEGVTNVIAAKFDDIYDRIQDQLSALRCVQVVIDAAANGTGRSEADTDLVAAATLLRRTWRKLDQLHDDLGAWQMRLDAHKAKGARS